MAQTHIYFSINDREIDFRTATLLQRLKARPCKAPEAVSPTPDEIWYQVDTADKPYGCEGPVTASSYLDNLRALPEMRGTIVRTVCHGKAQV